MITITDAACKVQTYHSVEALAPEMRALNNKAREQDGSK
jgi:hypothetical protein